MGIVDGTFLDIGCGGEMFSNTLALEGLGWRGTLVDNSEWAAEFCRRERPSRFVPGDATVVDLGLRPGVIDYLSLDIDAGTLDALRRLPLWDVSFRVITIEHDSYRFGDGPRDKMRLHLEGNGYDLLCEDVCSTDGSPFEDWWVHRMLVDPSIAEPFRCSGRIWTDILAGAKV